MHFPAIFLGMYDTFGERCRAKVIILASMAELSLESTIQLGNEVIMVLGRTAHEMCSLVGMLLPVNWTRMRKEFLFNSGERSRRCKLSLSSAKAPEIRVRSHVLSR